MVDISDERSAAGTSLDDNQPFFLEGPKRFPKGHSTGLEMLGHSRSGGNLWPGTMSPPKIA